MRSVSRLSLMRSIKGDDFAQGGPGPQEDRRIEDRKIGRNPIFLSSRPGYQLDNRARRLLAAGTPGRGADEPLAQATFPAGGAAMLWAINPLRVEPLARVTDLTFWLQLLFLLISLWCYLRAWRGPGGEHRFGPCYWCSVAAFGSAMLAYPFAFGYGGALLVLDWHPLRRFEGCSRWWRDARARRILLEKVPFLLLGGTILPTIAARLNPTGVWVAFQVDGHMNLFERAMQAFYVWAYYAWKPWALFWLARGRCGKRLRNMPLRCASTPLRRPISLSLSCCRETETGRGR